MDRPEYPPAAAALETAVAASLMTNAVGLFKTQASGRDFRPLFSPLSFPALLERCRTRPAEHPALSFLGETPLRYGDLCDCVDRLTGLLRAQGLGRGDKIALLGENHPHWGTAFFSITAIGAVAVPVMHEFPAPDVLRILAESEARAIFISDKFRPCLEGVSLPRLGLVIGLEDFSVATRGGGTAETKSSETAFTEIREDDPASLIFTSGTSGNSKGVLLTHRNLIANAMAIEQMAGPVTEADRLLSILPLAHATECTLGLIIPVMQGAAVYYLKKPPAASVLLPALRAVRPTIMIAVPLVIEKIFRTRVQPILRRNFLLRTLSRFAVTRKALNRLLGIKFRKSFGGCLRMFSMGGAALSEETAAFLDEAKFPYTVGYGLTETSPLTTGDPPESFVTGSCGRPLPGVEVRIADPNAETGEGEIEVKGPHVMAGYYTRPGEAPPEQPFTADGWLKTGDIGLLNQEGYLFVRGRLKNVIVHSSGKKTFPEEIETLLDERPGVGESLVYEEAGVVTAAVVFEDEYLKKLRRRIGPKAMDRDRFVAGLLKHIMGEVNDRLPHWSHLRKIEERKSPFEKTPSKKVKRYLHVSSGAGEGKK